MFSKLLNRIGINSSSSKSVGDPSDVNPSAAASSNPVVERINSQIGGTDLTNFNAALAKSSVDDLKDRFKTQNNESDRLDARVHDMFLAFCSSIEKEPEFCNPDDIAMFFKFLALMKLSYTTLSQTYYHSFKRVWRKRLFKGRKIPDDVTDSIKETLKAIKAEFKANGKTTLGKEKNPLMRFDLERIGQVYEHCLDSYIDSYDELSLMHYSLSCGARAMTCEGTLLGHIVSVVKSGGDEILVTLRQKIVKGDSDSKRQVTISGKLGEAGFIHYLNEHLKRKFNLDLTEFEKWTPSETVLNCQLWKLKKDAMCKMLQRRAVSAGYDEGFFCFHSLRSGYLCSFILESMINKNDINARLQVAAHVGGWSGKNGKVSTVQMTYFKTMAQKCFIANRTDGRTIVAEDLLMPERFHNIKLRDVVPLNNYKENTTREEFLATLPAHVQKFRDSSYNDQFFLQAISQYVSKNKNMEARAKNLAKKSDQYHDSRTRWKALRTARRTIFLRDVSSKKIEVSAETLHGLIQGWKPKTKKRREARCDGRKKRRKWTTDEEAIVKDLYSRQFPPYLIARSFVERTGQQVQDKIRNLIKNGELEKKTPVKSGK